MDISDQEKQVIMEARRVFMYVDGEPWVKKGNDIFDVGMGFYDGAEICELVGLYLLNQIKEKIGSAELGLYRDDGLGLFPDISASGAERIKKDLVEVFKQNDLRITVDANLKVVNFLDVTLNINNNTYYPYRKPNDTPIYVHKQSNHKHKHK